MSHFSKIQTHIHDIVILRKTLVGLGFMDITNSQQIKDSQGSVYNVDLVMQPSISKVMSEPVGFLWDGIKYDIITDLEKWPSRFFFNCFL